jgi:hypothetical protein
MLGQAVDVYVATASRDATAGEADRLARDPSVDALVGLGDPDGEAVVAAAARRHRRLFLGSSAESPRAGAFDLTPGEGAYVEAVARWAAARRPGARWLVVAADAAARWRAAAVAAARARGAASVAEVVWHEALARALPGADVVVLGTPAPALLAAVARARDVVVALPFGDLPPDATDLVGTVVRATLWHDSLTRHGAAQLNERFARRFGAPMTARDWAGWMAVKIVWEVVARHGTTAGALATALAHGARFDGHKGRPLVFGADRRLGQPLYVVGRRPDGASEEVVLAAA